MYVCASFHADMIIMKYLCFRWFIHVIWQEYEWFNVTMRNFLQGEDVTLQGTLDVLKDTKSQLEQQVQETVDGLTSVATQIGLDVQGQVSLLQEKYSNTVVGWRNKISI